MDQYCPRWRLHAFSAQPLWQYFQAHICHFVFLFSNSFNFAPVFIIQKKYAKSIEVGAWNVDVSTAAWETQQLRQYWVAVCW